MGRNKGKQQGGFLDLLRWYVGFTSVGALHQVKASEERCSKLFWAVLFSVGIVLTTWNLYVVYQEYMEYPVF